MFIEIYDLKKEQGVWKWRVYKVLKVWNILTLITIQNILKYLEETIQMSFIKCSQSHPN